MSHRWFRLGCALAVTCGLVTATQIWAVTPSASTKEVSSKSSLTAKLGGIDRFSTFVSIDKPIYKSGESVFIRGVILNGADHKPLPDKISARAQIAIKGAGGALISQFGVNSIDSIWGAQWIVPPNQAGGEYTIEVTYPRQGFPPAQRKFDVRSYRAQRLNSQIKFVRDGYGPGDKVEANLQVARAEGGIPEGAKVTVDARVDGVPIKADDSIVDATGHCKVSFSLPAEMEEGDGVLSLAVADGGVVEVAAKTIPILMQKVDLQMYPEGGDIITGFPNRVYVQAKQPDGKPADIKCNLMMRTSGSDASLVSTFQTEHEGRGRFQFVPLSGKNYFLQVIQPSGISKTYPLPASKSKGVVVHSNKDVFASGDVISLDIGSSESSYKITVSKHEVEIASSTVKVHSEDAKQKKLNTVLLDVPREVDGVLTVTIWDKNGTPLAERLIFRQPARKTKISVTADRDDYTPGDYARLRIKTSDEDGKPVSAIVGLTVTDESTLELVDKREQAPRLPVMVLLEPEVRDLADADLYLDSKNPKSGLATDLLLATQGWRRFALVNVDEFLLKNGDDGRRALVAQQKGANTHPTFVGVPVGALAGAGGKIHRKSSSPRVDVLRPAAENGNALGRVEGPRNTNLFQVEPSVIDERHYTSGRDERHQKTSPTLPEGSPIPDNDSDDVVRMPANAFVREYAHPVSIGQKSQTRREFFDTVYWSSGVKTDAVTGEASVGFGLNDSVSSFKVFADGFEQNGAIGASTTVINSVKPIFVEAKLPLEVTVGDQILLPINVINGTDKAFSEVALDAALGKELHCAPLRRINNSLDAKQRVRWILPVTVGSANGEESVSLTARAGRYEDMVVRKLAVKPQGYPGEVALGGFLDAETTITHTLHIPARVEPGSLKSKVVLYSTPLANLTSALERMIQEPNGCFEQTSSTSYPLTMAQQYFQTHSGVDPKLVSSASEKLEHGYQKLVSFWCPDRGYEWFGQNPGHEALTAFGILHFTDMSKVKGVDQNMIATTREWLLKQKDGHGGFTRNARSLHSWIEDRDCSNAYIIWALLESGQAISDLKVELEALKIAADKSSNNYVVALAANAFSLAGDTTEARKLMERLASKQKSDGSVSDVTASIVGSSGESLEVEGTSLATLAWLRDKKFSVNVDKGVKFLADSCKAGRYGSTQATVLALRAIVDYDKQRSHPKIKGRVRLVVDGLPKGDWLSFDEKTQGELTLPNIDGLLTPGDHKVELRMDKGCQMPYSISATYNTFTPLSDKDCKLDIAVNSAQQTIVEGGAAELSVTVRNLTKEVIPNPIAIVGLPGGLEIRHDQLKELVKKEVIDAYEVRGREIVLYWRSMAPEAKLQFPLSAIAAVPGTYTGPPSRTYLYYTDEHKKWVDGVKIEISPKSSI